MRAFFPVLALSLACAPAEPGAATQNVQASTSAERAPEGVAPSLSGGPNSARATTSASAAPSASAWTPPPMKAPGSVRYTVAAMGDSLTDPKSHGGKYLDVLRERCPKSTFESFGKGGNMVNMMRKRFMRDVYAEGQSGPPPNSADSPPVKWSHVLILGGLGDALSNETAFRTKDKIAKDIGEMVDMARGRGAKVYVLTLPPWGAMRDYNAERGKITADVNAWIAEAAKEGRIDGYFDTRPSLICGDPERLCEKFAWKDGIHWSAEGHRAVGDALHRALFADCQ